MQQLLLIITHLQVVIKYLQIIDIIVDDNVTEVCDISTIMMVNVNSNTY